MADAMMQPHPLWLAVVLLLACNPSKPLVETTEAQAFAVAPIQSITLTPVSAALLVGQQQLFTPRVLRSDGSVVVGPVLTWTVTAGSVIGGTYTAGLTTVVARASNGVTGKATVRVDTVPTAPPPPPPPPLPPPPPPGSGQSYAASFTATENPLSQGGRWVNGFTQGLDWSDMASASGLAYGVQRAGYYNDPTALLTGPWAPNQKVSAVVGGVANDACSEEIELRLRSMISPHVNSGYEITWRNSTDPNNTYLIIVRWDGGFGRFAYLFDQRGQPRFFIQPGDTLSATMTGSLISAYKNSVLLAQVSDATFASGAPGIGMTFAIGDPGCSAVAPSFGFTSMAASELP